MSTSLQRMVDEIFGAMNGYVARHVDPLRRQLDALLARQPERGEKGADGKDGRDGKDADADAIATKVLEQVAKTLDAIPMPKDGKDGRDGDKGERGEKGESITVEQLMPLIERLVSEAVAKVPAIKGDAGKDGASVDPKSVEQMVADAVARLPKAKDGIDGKDGKDGEKGMDGADGRDGKDADPEVIRSEVQRAIDQIPKPRDGRDGKDADPAVVEALVIKAVAALPKPADGRDGRDGIGENGKDGRDGRDADPELVRQEIEIALSKMQLPRGEPGRDGLSLEDIEIDAKDGGRVLVFKCKAGDREIVREVRTALTIYRGIFRHGDTYEAGDSVTYAGSLWIAKRDTMQAPGGDDWQLSVKRGQRGKDAVNAGDPS